MNSNVVRENEEYLKDAINDGISGDAIASTLEDIMTTSNLSSKTPVQLKETVDVIVSMKNTEEKINEEYESELVKNNSEKIKEALNNGLSSEEISQELIKSTENIKNKEDKRRLKFITMLVSKMKKKQKKYNVNKQNTKGYQKTKK